MLVNMELHALLLTQRHIGAADVFAAPPARKARRNAPKEKCRSEKGVKTTIKGKRTRAKKPRKIPSVHMDHPDWRLSLSALSYLDAADELQG